MIRRILFFSLLPAGLALAADKPPHPLDGLWNLGTLYKDDQNPVVQNVRFTGRFHGDYVRVDADQGDEDQWNVRRLRLGAKMKLFGGLTAHAEADVNPQERDPTYTGMTDLYLAWTHSPALEITVGKQGVPFTLDGATSSKELLTPERNNLSNNLWFPGEYLPGVSVNGKRGAWLYRLGGYSSGEKDKGFGEFNAGWFGIASLGYSLAESLGLKEALVKMDFVHQQEDEKNDATRSLANIGSINGRFEGKDAGLRADISAAEGHADQGDLWGAVLMPFYNLTEKLQAVGRVTYVEGDDPASVRLARYESEVVSKRGDEYLEYYAGLNYYLYGHKLKLQSGFTWAEMKDSADAGGEYDGWAWTAALRVAW